MPSPSRPPSPLASKPLPALEQDRLRSRIASRLFGGAAQPLRIGRHTILKRIGAGGQGIVYAAYDETLDRKVAIKLLNRPEDPRQLGCLRQEALALASLSHPNVVKVYEVGTHEGQVYIAMEYLPGERLDEIDPPPDLADHLSPWIDAAKGLCAMHAQGLVHRDFKPANTMVLPEGRAKLFDFGLALRPSMEKAPRPAGTPTFMAPEQRDHGTVDARADQYSFCVALWRSFAPDSNRERPTSTRPPGVPRWLFSLLAQGSAPQPEDRFNDMQAIVRALQAGLARAASRRRRWGIIAGVTALALGATAFVAKREHPCDHIDAPWNRLVGSLEAHASAASPSAGPVFYRLSQFARSARDMHHRQCAAASPDAKSRSAFFATQSPCYLSAARWVSDVQARISLDDAKNVDLAQWLKAPLPSLHACQLRHNPKGEDLSARQRSELETMLSRAQIQRALHKFEDTQRLADQLLAHPDLDKAPAIAAKAQLLQARALLSLAKLEAAKSSLDSAYRLAETLDDDDLRLEALTLRAKHSTASGDHALAESQMQDAYPLAQRAGVSVDQRIEYFSKACRIDRMSPDLCLHYERCQEGLALLASSTSNPVALSDMQERVAWTLFEAGQVDRAVALAKQAAQDLRKAMGRPEDSIITLSADALVLTLGAEQLRMSGQGPTAWRDLADQAQRVYARYLKAYGPKSPPLYYIRSNLGEILVRAGNLQAAKAPLLAALEQQKNHVGRYFPLLWLGRIDVQQGRDNEGHRKIRQAIELMGQINKKRSGNAIPELGMAHFAMARSLGPGAQGLSHAQLALRAYEEAEASTLAQGPRCEGLIATHVRYAHERDAIAAWIKDHRSQAPLSPPKKIEARR